MNNKLTEAHNDNYLKVKERILKLKEEGKWKDISLNTTVERLEKTNDSSGKEKHFVIVKAQLTLSHGTFTGIAMETQGIGDVNITHFVENAETSAVGRALSFAGIRDNSDVASEEEIVIAKEENKIANKQERLKTGAELISKAMEKKETKEPAQKKVYNEQNIPIFKEPDVKSGKRAKVERDKVINFLEKEGLMDPAKIVGAMIKAKTSEKYKSFNELVLQGTYDELLQTFKKL